MSKRDVVEVYLALWVAIQGWMLGALGLAKLLGARPGRIGFGAGLTVRKFVLRGAEIRLALPIPGAYVSYVGAGNAPESEPGGFRELPLWRRLSLALGPNLLGLLVGVACLGLPRATLSAIHAPGQLLFEQDRALSDFLPVFMHGPASVTFGVLFVKLNCWNLLPIPTLATWHALLELRPLSARLPGGVTRAEQYASLGGLAVLVLVFLRWIRAGLRVLGHG